MAETVWAGSRDRFPFLFGNGSNRNREWGLLGRDSPEREQRDMSCLVREWLAGTGSGACWAETSQSKSRERFPVLFVLKEHDQGLP